MICSFQNPWTALILQIECKMFLKMWTTICLQGMENRSLWIQILSLHRNNNRRFREITRWTFSSSKWWIRRPFQLWVEDNPNILDFINRCPKIQTPQILNSTTTKPNLCLFKITTGIFNISKRQRSTKTTYNSKITRFSNFSRINRVNSFLVGSKILPKKIRFKNSLKMVLLAFKKIRTWILCDQPLKQLRQMPLHEQ